MTENQNPQESAQPFVSEINTRLRDIDERNKLIRERVLLLGKNLISSRQDLEKELKEIKEENKELKKEIDKIKKISSALSSEFAKFAKREELYLIERMLRDFQPMEFMRKKDVEELINETIHHPKKQIKTTETKE
jgi:predicted RNase H-like nuclease (RuvC/YqgF family)